MRIAISGPAGSGKTTVCMLVAQRLGYDFVLMGQVFRKMALEREMDLEVFGRLAEENETIDKELDERMLALAKASEDIVLEGRLTGLMLRHHSVPAMAVHISAPEEVRVRRIAQRERKPDEEARKELRMRENSERKRYLAYYGIDLLDASAYDMCIDSSSTPADKIADMIVDKVKEASAKNAREGEETC